MKWFLLILLAAGVTLAAGCDGGETPTAGGGGNVPAANNPPGPTAGAGAPAAPAKVDPGDYKTRPSGLKYAVLKPGDGPEAKEEQNVFVHYTGWLQSNGKKFDSSLDRGEPIEFPLGHGAVIKGWEEGVLGMKVGEQRQLVIPPKLAYGPEGRPPVIPPNSTLIFDVELVRLGEVHQH
jgi:FKBP-type peptidyl-prolyl cis-trans isomerase FkpA